VCCVSIAPAAAAAAAAAGDDNEDEAAIARIADAGYLLVQ